MRKERDDTPLGRLGAALARMREMQGWTLDDAAERTGVGRATIARYESGRADPKVGNLMALCGAYGHRLAEVFAEAGV